MNLETMLSQMKVPHERCRRKYYPKLFLVWQGMRNRCNNPKVENYCDYGGRGIKVCDKWQHSSYSFIRWAIDNGYKEGLQLDRIDVNGNYEPSNCRFITPRENAQNKRNNVLLTVCGETKCVSEWLRKYPIPISERTIYRWIKSGKENRVVKLIEEAQP
jgi:hypothetical protein